MKVRFSESFARDLRRISDKGTLSRIRRTIDSVERAMSLDEVPQLKKLRGAGSYYRIRVGDHRMGLIIESDLVTFVRCLHRRDIYRYFP